MNLRDMPKAPLAIVAVMFATGAALYQSLGPRIPMHWNVWGQIDRWEPKSFGVVFTLPLVALGLYALFAVMPYLDPRRLNLKQSGRAYGLVLTSVTLLMAVVYGATLATAMGVNLPVDRLIVASVGVMIAYMGTLMRTVKQNWTMGFRFSWTLADENVWAKTNDLGGRLFIGAGVLGVVGALMPAPYNFFFVTVPIVAVAPVTYIYSMKLYRQAHPEEMRNGVPRA
jgi:uncharacterized membrane protein